MRGRTWLVLLAALVVVAAAIYLSPVSALQSKPAPRKNPAATAVAAEPAPAPSPEPAPPPAPIEPVNHCSNCVPSFCAANKVKCTATGNCCSGKGHANCEYTCECDDTCTTVNIPSNACYTLPSEDCACRHVVCQNFYCKAQDQLCGPAVCVNGCCVYQDCQTSACNQESCPPNTCPGSC